MIRIFKYSDIDKSAIFMRSEPPANVEETVAGIIADVHENGDAALVRYAKKFDGAELSALEVTPRELDDALKSVDPCFLEVIEKAAANIKAFHRCQIRSGFVLTKENGVVLGQKILPLHRVGVYVPGGTASYPSTVLMNCIPAKLAGVSEIIVTTPPSRDGRVNPNILAAAKLGGADRIFKSGGAQAVAALAYGTESVPPADKIVGPGNAFVAEAKKQVYGRVAVDMIAGPSEILVIADDTCSAEYVAADMLSQAEHDVLASAVLVTDSAELAEKVGAELEKQLPALPRYDIARASIDNNGKIIVAENLKQAVEISNALAPEHLEICVDNPFDYLDMVRNAGSIFLGKYCPEALGDYFAGPNHTLPTLGTARFSSPLSVDDFVKKSSFTYYTPEALAGVKNDIACFARKEGLEAHARSVTVRFDK
ncbi:histidinol dehydrogenase [Sporobacter termitidis DSM 10068]|uniref:Histidinol dehydrogenase n=1 Tax=Sporobacter termitidis DSM 10068 TaxID=1123282 RepID=A0A1M5VQY7_9FIRM|nr:histidinol dehydrogenase [Sporobacter termitidis]SHH77665.1 histidinol dehydrogenase [Sporobacter termitidis DSM 10068]